MVGCQIPVPEGWHLIPDDITALIGLTHHLCSLYVPTKFATGSIESETRRVHLVFTRIADRNLIICTCKFTNREKARPLRPASLVMCGCVNTRVSLTSKTWTTEAFSPWQHTHNIIMNDSYFFAEVWAGGSCKDCTYLDVETDSRTVSVNKGTSFQNLLYPQALMMFRKNWIWHADIERWSVNGRKGKKSERSIKQGLHNIDENFQTAPEPGSSPNDDKREIILLALE